MRRLSQDLKANGFDVWIDESGLPPGTPEWTAAIEDAIEDAFCAVVILSPDAKESEWVTREIRYADEQGRSVIPVLASGTARTAIPIELISTQYVDARRDYGSALGLLLTRLHQLAGTPPKDIPRVKRRRRVWPLLVAALGVGVAGLALACILSGVLSDLLASVLPPDGGPSTQPTVTPDTPATAAPTDAPTLTPTPPHAPPIVNDTGEPLYDEGVKVVEIPRGGSVQLSMMDIWSAPVGATTSCASGYLSLTWIVREPYPEGGEDFEIHTAIPFGEGRTELLTRGSSGEVTVGYCDELTLKNISLEDYVVEIRYASGGVEQN